MKKFDIKFSIKKLLGNPLSSLCIFLNLAIILVISGTLGHFLYEVPRIIEYQEKSSYGNFDYRLFCGSGTEKKYFELDKVDFSKEQVLDEVSLIKASFISELGSGDVLNAYCTETDNIRKLIDFKATMIDDNQVIITKELAQKYDLEVGDSFSFETNNFEIIEIIKYQSIISNQSEIIMNRNSAKLFYDIEGDVNNIANNVYYDVKNLDQFVMDISNCEYINDNNLGKGIAYDQTTVDMQKSLYKAIICIISLFLILTLILLFNSLIKRNMLQRKKDFETLDYLGASPNYGIKIHFIGVCLLLFFAFIIAIILGYFFIFVGTNVLFEKYPMHVNQYFYLGAFLGIVGIVLITFYNYFNSKYPVKRHLKPYYLFIAGFFGSILFYILSIKYEKTSILFYIFFFIFLFGLFKTIIYFIPRGKKGIFSIFNLKNIKNSHVYHNVLTLLFICFISIMVIFCLGKAMKNKFVGISEEFKFKYIVYDKQQEIDMTNYEGEYTRAFVTSAGQIMGIEEISFIVSVKAELVNDYTNYDLSPKIIKKLQSKGKLYIVLPERYKTIYDFEEDDLISVYLNTKYENVEATIAGFIPHEFNIIAITNLIECDLYSDSENTILIKDRIKGLSGGTIIDKDSVFSTQISRYYPMIDFLLFFVFLVVGLLVLVITNNSLIFFEEQKRDYSLFKVLGMSRIENFKLCLKEIFFIFALLIPIVIFGSIIMITNISSLTVLFGTYVKLTIEMKDILIASVICIITYFISQAVYIYKLVRD